MLLSGAPPCQAYSQVTTVFVGTVAEALATNSGRISHARIQVDRTYKGVPPRRHTFFLQMSERVPIQN